MRFFTLHCKVRHRDARAHHPRYGATESTKEAATFAVRIQAHGERRYVALPGTTKREAAKSAMALYKLVDLYGWDKGLAEFRGEAPPVRNNLPDPIPFVGMRTAKERPTRYRSEIENPEVLLVAGTRELAGATMETEDQAI